MQVIPVADGADFALGEETGQRNRTGALLHGPRVVVGCREESRAPSVAAKEQPGLREPYG